MENRNGVMSYINAKYSALTEAERCVADYILNNPDKILEQGIVEVAKSSNAGQGTVIRLCQRMGLDGFKELKKVLAIKDDGQKTVGKQYAEILSQSIASTFSNETVKKLEEVKSLVVDAKDVFIIGAKATGFVAHEFAYKMTKIEHKVIGLSDYYFQQEMSGRAGQGDVAIFLSVSGKTYELCELAKTIKEKGVKVIALTSDETSPLHQIADIGIPLSFGEHLRQIEEREAPLNSRLLMGIVLDDVFRRIYMDDPEGHEEIIRMKKVGRIKKS